MKTVVDTSDGYKNYEDNQMLGFAPEFRNSRINLSGKGNVIYCEEGLVLEDSRISFNGDNALVYLSASRHHLKIVLDAWRSSTFYIGGGYYTNGALHAIPSERQAILIGDEALLSFGIWLRTADPHLVYSCETHERVNPSKPVTIGDHVWIGQNATILKGSDIGSGSIIGGCSVVAGKQVASNTSWAGNPARQIAENVFFTDDSVHNYTPKQSKKSIINNTDEFIYFAEELDPEKPGLRAVAEQLAKIKTAEEKLALLQERVVNNQDHNRFAITRPMPAGNHPSGRGRFFRKLLSQ